MCPHFPYFSVSRIKITLAVDKVSMEDINGRLVSFYVEKERLLRILRHQVELSPVQLTLPCVFIFFVVAGIDGCL